MSGVDSTIAQIERADQLLFDAGVAVLYADTDEMRKYVDRLIMHARVELKKLRGSLTATST